MTLTIACATGQAFEVQVYDAAINHVTCQRKGVEVKPCGLRLPRAAGPPLDSDPAGRALLVAEAGPRAGEVGAVSRRLRNTRARLPNGRYRKSPRFFDAVVETVTRRFPDGYTIPRCWCGTRNAFVSTRYVDRGCGGSMTIHCLCGGDFCVCHHHGETECFGCQDCECDWDDDEYEED